MFHFFFTILCVFSNLNQVFTIWSVKTNLFIKFGAE